MSANGRAHARRLAMTRRRRRFALARERSTTQYLTAKQFLAIHKVPLVVRVVDTHGWRYYAKPEDVDKPKNWYASVTNILDLAVTDSMQEYFKRSTKKKQVAALKAATEGTALHELVAKDLASRRKLRNIVRKRLPFYDTWKAYRDVYEISAMVSELPIFSDKYGFAGTLDHVGKFDTLRSFMDLKTGWYGIKTGWQMAAYKHGLMEMLGSDCIVDGVPLRDYGMVGIQIRRSGKKADSFMYRHENYCWSAFLSAFNCWKAMYVHRLTKFSWKYRSLHEVPEVAWNT